MHPVNCIALQFFARSKQAKDIGQDFRVMFFLPLTYLFCLGTKTNFHMRLKIVSCKFVYDDKNLFFFNNFINERVLSMSILVIKFVLKIYFKRNG